MIMSKHALIRSQQRGIDTRTISIILKYGHFEYTRDGAKMWRLNEKEKKFAKSDLGEQYIKVEKKLGFIIEKKWTNYNCRPPNQKIL